MYNLKKLTTMGNGLFNDGGKWAWSLLTKQRKQTCADNSDLSNNGTSQKVFQTILKYIGNGYKG